MKNRIKKCLSALFFVAAFVMCVSVSADATDGTGKESIELNKDCFKIQLLDEGMTYIYNTEEKEPDIEVVSYEVVDGKEVEKEVVDEACYDVAYENNVNAGNAEIIVTGKEEKGYTGELHYTFKIEKASIKNTAVRLRVSNFMYNGSEQKPEVVVALSGKKLVKGEDYEVQYVNNVEVGKATIWVKGIGNCTGSKKTEFIIYPSATTLSAATAYNQIKLSWSKVPGATGYKIYKSTSENSGYSLLKDVTSGSTVTYTDKSVTFGTTYYYKILSYVKLNGTIVDGTYSNVKSIQVLPATPVISKVSRSSATALTVTWGQVGGASGYVIYRSDSENGTYSKIGTASGGSTVTYTDSNCTCGKTYYYKVRAYRTVSSKNYYSAYSAAKSYYTVPAKVKWDLTNIKVESTAVTLKWNKATGAEGYYIYRSDSKDGTYSKVATITSGSTLSWKNTGLTKDKKYYYKICGYLTRNGNVITGYTSDIYTKSKAGWKYVNGYKLYYDANGQLVKDVSSIIGKQSSYVIKVNKQMNTVTVYAKDGSNGYIIPVKAFICSTGAATPLGTFYTPQKYRWHTLDGPSYGQWCTRITGSILFHSVWYYQQSNTTLSVAQYNKLGTTASHGCVRLTAGDAKWVYDNCALKTKVIIYNSSTSGPLGKPTAYKLASWHTWDPTDPNVKSKCKSKGCH